MNPNLLKLYAITDRAWLGENSLESVVEQVLQGGATLLQLREKNQDDDAFLAEARSILKVCNRHGVPLLINDNLEVARQLGIGAHIGQDDATIEEARRMLGPDAIIGVSCNCVQQAIEAQRNGASYLGVGAVFKTGTKLDADYVDRRELEAICANTSIPVVAIGGINSDNVDQLAGSGIAGISLISALFAAENPKLATKTILEKVEKLLEPPFNPPPGAIIDLDGTLLDSLPEWDKLADNYLISKGKTPQPNLLSIIGEMELPQSAKYLKDAYDLSEDVDTIQDQLKKAIEHVYSHKAQLFPNAKFLLENLQRQQVRIALFSATSVPLAKQALNRLKITEFFDGIYSTEDFGVTKSNPDAFLKVLGRLGTARDKTIVIEDAPYAIKGAQLAGFKTYTQDILK